MKIRGLLLSASMLLTAGCGADMRPVTVFDAHEAPGRLSEWGVLVADGRRLRLNSDVMPYGLNTPLFSDYALKLRTIWMPTGPSAQYRSDEEFDFPVGTIISKTFHYERAGGDTDGYIRLIKADREGALDVDGTLDLDDYFLAETRLLVRYEDGWQAFPYVWNAGQNEALLEPAGELLELQLVSPKGESEPIVYVVPDTNQCAACHTPNHGSGALRPLGPKARQLNRDYSYIGGTENQLAFWATSGRLEGLPHTDMSLAPRIASWSNSGNATLEQRARAYLDVNCAHCHNPRGAADTSALNLNIEAEVDRRFGICKPPVAVGRGSGGRPYDIYPGRAEDSILLFRMEDTDPAIAMPELGRATNHSEGIAVVRDWINSLSGAC
jgi:uncharacterized repeat protein (TIGR03806 family)